MRRAIAVATMALAACATPPTAPVSQAPVATADSPFDLGGRISARRGDAGVAGSFAWRHEPAHDAIELSSPLGQMIAKLEGDASGATVQLSDGRTETAPTWRALTERAFGVTIPVDGLAAWIRAQPRHGVPYDVGRDSAGRVSELRQDGWDIVYAYAGDAPAPFRVTASYPGADPIEVRVVIDRRG
ncbi:MAG TPA: outer membrane lipoprotein LolB [Casimicrobiaceae bacterium]|jgi:outer membrane lipoprotein LolB|nr:outer membrane lipoprotein LolB [Casimicrobiaceae bacterium]